MGNPINYWYQKYLSLKAEMDKMKAVAVEGTVTERTVRGSRPETFAITTKHFESSTLKMGDKVKLIVIKDD